MKHAKLLALLFLCLALFYTPVSDAKVRIVATNNDLAAIAHAVGGEHVTITSLAKQNQNPHDVDARPSFLVPLSRADLLILTGLDLESGWLPPLLDNARNQKIQKGQRGYVDASTFIRVQGVPPAGTDRASGDVHPAGNPHYLYDARAAKHVAIGIRDALIRTNTNQRAYWTERTRVFVQKLEAFADQERARFQQIPAERRALVSYHDSTTYLFDWLQISLVETLEPNPGIPPTTRHTANVLQKIRDRQVRAVIQEPYYPRNTAKTLVKLANIQHIIFPSSTDYPSQDYLQHLQEVTDALYRALRP